MLVCRVGVNKKIHASIFYRQDARNPCVNLQGFSLPYMSRLEIVRGGALQKNVSNCFPINHQNFKAGRTFCVSVLFLITF